MLCGFPRAYENNRDVPAVAIFENGIVRDIHFMQCGVEFPQQGLDGRFRFLAKMAAGASIERDFTRAGGLQTRIFGMERGCVRSRRLRFRRGRFHGFGLEYFWNGPA